MTWYFHEGSRKKRAAQVPTQTPRCVQFLIAATVCASILLPVLSAVLFHFFGTHAFIEWLPLSSHGLSNGWYWQFASYLLIQSPGFGITISLLLALAFHMALLWISGSETATQFGCASFLSLYFGAGTISGLAVSFLFWLFSSPFIFSGSSAAVYAVLTTWVMLLPELELSFFFLIRLKAKWVVAFVLALSLLISLSHAYWEIFLNDLFGILCGWIAGQLVWKLPNPYPVPFPAFSLKGIFHPFRENDDAFMERMLGKVAKKGIHSLTKRERDRMQRISKKRKFNPEDR